MFKRLYPEIRRIASVRQGETILGHTFQIRQVWLNTDHIVSMVPFVFHAWEGEPKTGKAMEVEATEVKTVLGDIFILEGIHRP